MKSAYSTLLFLVVLTDSYLGLQSLASSRLSCIRSSPQSLEAAKGFGGSKGFGSTKSSPKAPKRPSKASIQKKLKKKYGGISPEDIAKGTQRIIDERLHDLPAHIQEAVKIYQFIQKSKHGINLKAASPVSNIPEQQTNEIKRALDELDRLMKDHSLTLNDLHNELQAATWDASADAKMARSITGNMPIDIQRKIQKGCDIVATTIGVEGKCLDVGCGFGVLAPYLKKAGVAASQHWGIDLSPEMIRNAEMLYPSSSWTAGDFFAYQPETSFDAILFCSSLHDLPDPMKALSKAVSLLASEGKIVIMHPQGASQVLNQVRSNPVLVRRGLPLADELQSVEGMKLLVDPGAPNSQQESREGYIAVLQKL